MKKILALTLWFFSSIAPGVLLADGADPVSAGDDRIKLIPYDETAVYTITTRYSYQTNVVFSPKEEIETISVGDRSLWQIIPAGNRIFIRPMEEGVVTNMTVLTNKRSYQFDLKSLPPEKKEGNIYVAKFVYKDEHARPAPAPTFTPTFNEPPPFAMAPTPPPSARTAQTQVASAPTPVQESYPVHPNYNYTYSGPDDLAPLQVSDDGRSTFIKFRDMSQPMPNVFSVENGIEKPASYSVRDGAMVVDTVASQLLLKTSAGMVRVYNESLSPGS